MEYDITMSAPGVGAVKAEIASDTLTRGANVGRYVVLGRIGSGAMGVVYAAYDPDLDRKVALKVVQTSGETDVGSNGRARLVREAQALAKLSSPFVVGVYDVGTLGDHVWIAMEFVAGQTLRTWSSERSRPTAEIIRVMVDVARGIADAHKVGLVHRDLKPDNVMIGADGRVRVMDFGLAHGRALSETDLAVASTLAANTQARPEVAALGLNLTRTGAVQGTPAYMSPEQWCGREAGPTADQFSWSVMAWELLFGQKPFEGETMVTLAAAVLGGKRRPPARGRDVPAWLTRILDRGLSTEPEKRWLSTENLLQDIERAQTRNRWRRTTGAITIALVALTTAGLYLRALLLPDERDQPVVPSPLVGRPSATSLILHVDPPDLVISITPVCDRLLPFPGAQHPQCGPTLTPDGDPRVINDLAPGSYWLGGYDPRENVPFFRPVKVSARNKIINLSYPSNLLGREITAHHLHPPRHTCDGTFEVALDVRGLRTGSQCILYWKPSGAQDFQTANFNQTNDSTWVSSQKLNPRKAHIDYLAACFDINDRVLLVAGSQTSPLQSSIRCSTTP